MASYSLNERALALARGLIRGRQYVLDSDWGDAQPKAEDENSAAEWQHKEIELAAHELLQLLDRSSA